MPLPAKYPFLLKLVQKKTVQATLTKLSGLLEEDHLGLKVVVISWKNVFTELYRLIKKGKNSGCIPNNKQSS